MDSGMVKVFVVVFFAVILLAAARANATTSKALGSLI